MTKPNWKPIKVKLGQIQAWGDNPRMSTKAQAQRIIASERKFGQPIPFLLMPEVDGRFPLLDGHQRLAAWQTVYGADYQMDAMVCDRALSDDERREMVVVLHTGATGSWNWEALAGWSAGDLQSWGMDKDALKNWNNDAENLKFMLEAKKEDDAEASDEFETKDRFEEVANKWGTADGQLWKAGNHFILCGDSLDAESYTKILQGKTPKLINADPPYGVSIVAANGYVGGGESAKGMIPFGGRKRLGTADGSKPFGSKAVRGSDGAAHIVEVGKYPVIIGDENTDTAKKSAELLLDMYPDAYQAWWGANYYVDVFNPSPCWLVWNKQTTGHFADCELAWTNAENSAKLFTHKWNGMLRDSERGKRWHPTQKPAALAEWIIGLFTEKGDVILDPFGGAGWTLLAAQSSERQAFIIEKSHEYVAVILQRFLDATGIQPELVE